MTSVYFIPGLGTTPEVFKGLALEGKRFNYISYPDPKPKETISTYAHRLNEQIKEKDEVILVGMSMGGFLAQEIAQIRPVKKIILISSYSKNQEWLIFLQWVQKINLQEMLVQRAFKDLIIGMLSVLLGYPNWVGRKALEMAKKFSKEYYEFAVKELLTWKPKDLNIPVVKIHGSKDELFPYSSVNPKYTVEGGRHLMIFNYAQEIRDFLMLELE